LVLIIIYMLIKIKPEGGTLAINRPMKEQNSTVRNPYINTSQ